MNDKVALVKLNTEQIERAKLINGDRKQITHAVICGYHGQLFGTEKQCRKYYSAWSKIFPYLFSGGIELDAIEITDYKFTPELVMVLINANDLLEKATREDSLNRLTSNKNLKKSFFPKLFGR